MAAVSACVWVTIHVGSREEDEAVLAAVRRAGGSPAASAPGAPGWLRSIPVVGPFFERRRIEGVHLAGCKVDSSDLARLVRRLRRFDSLEWLQLTGTKIDERVLREIAALENLEMLDLSQTPVRDEHLVHLQKLRRLRGLGLSGTLITDRGLGHLRPLSNLRGLLLDGTDVSNAAIPVLAALPQLTRLSISNTGITDEGLERLAERFPGLAVSDD
ncbi:MAG: hypothetical protein KY476_17765 [Planctomycetes bacterium]|nr:hypothetical protein [Planctomycetota bacterium]